MRLRVSPGRNGRTASRGAAGPAPDALASLMLGFMLLATAAARADVVLPSPGGRVQVTVGVNAQHELFFRMQRDGAAVLEDSPLGVTVDAVNLGSQVQGVISTAPMAHRETYPVHGGHATADVRYNEIYVSAGRQAASDSLFSLVFRAYDDGVAYRYLIPGEGGRVIGGEASGWAFPAGSWIAFQTNTGNYEGIFYHARLGDISDGIGGPFTVELPGGGYATVSEGALTDYSGLTFRASYRSNVIQSQFLDDTTWTLPGGALTPWRLVIASADLNGLADSDLVSSLNAPPDPTLFPAGAATSWIRPGRTVWSWFTDWNSPASLATQIQYVDYARQLGFEYCLVDKGWEQGFAGGGDPFPALAGLVQYAHSGGRAVDIWVWKEWNEIRDDAARQAFFDAVARAGVVGVKVDNLNPADNESQRNVNFYVKILRDAASRRLMINFHGCTKNSGLSRTWPNELTRESLLGLEYDSVMWLYGSALPPEHDAYLPFTRFVTGPGDYTPLCMDPRKLGKTTLAHQLATTGIFVSPMQVVADDPANLLAHGEALDVIKALPAVWDETRVLPGSAIGKLAVYARRTGESWFLFALNGDSTAGKLLQNVDLSFLGARRYAAVFLQDATSRTLAREEAYGFSRTTGLDLPLLPGGGFVAMFTPTDWTDRDGDLMPDATDCAPLSATLATPVTYFLDRDGDQYGDAATTIALPMTTPFPGWVPWGNDPKDSDAGITATPAPKGTRLLGLDFGNPGENGAWRPDLARRLGAEVAPLNLDWSFLEPQPGSRDAAASQTLALARRLYGAEGFQVSLTLNPIHGSALTAPADIKSGLESGALRWSDPAVISRFSSLLDFVHAQLSPLPVLALQVGQDLDYYLPQAGPTFAADYGAFFRAVAAHARQLWPGLKVSLTATAEGLIKEPSSHLFQVLNHDTDVVSVSYLPRREDYSALPPTAVGGQIRQLLDLYPGRPIYFQSVGYPSAPLVGSSQIQQSQFLMAFFDAWDRDASRIPYACFTRLNDLTEEAAGRQAAALAGRSPAARVRVGEFLRGCGLRTDAGGGQAKAAYQTLRSLAFERGWWRVPPQASRSFRMGFTPLPYDQALESDPPASALDWTYQQIRTQADVVALYFDGGVPWVEAGQDDLTSPVLPYSAGVRGAWQSHLNRLPLRSKLLVAVNPLGVPRNLIAPYWGVGQGYYHDASFNRVGTGRVADFENRLPPDPWGTQPFNSPMVKQAFLSYCRRVLDTFKPDYLVTGAEVNLLAQADPLKFRQYVELQQYLYTSLKAIPRYRGTQILVSLTSEHFLKDEFGVPCLIEGIKDPGLIERQWQAVRDLLPWVDMVGLSIYPIKTRYLANTMPAWFFERLFSAFAAVTSKPLLVSECGYPAVPFNVSGQPFQADPLKQERFLRLLFDETQRAGNVRLLINFVARDTTAMMDRLRQGALQTPPYINPDLASFFQFFEFNGLYDATGGTRPATRLWQQVFGLPYTGPDAARSRAADWDLYQ